MRFKEVIGQEQSKKLLSGMVYQQRVPHALMILSKTGEGSLAMGLAMAQMLQCEQPAADDACGTCPACLKSARFVHPDIHFSFPTIGTNAVSTDFLDQWREKVTGSPYFDVNTWLQHIGADNKQGNITKAECLAIVRKLSLQIFEGRHKVLLMWLPEYLGTEGNRLLKLIEEPPENTVFILIAEDDSLILNTILSRCQLVKLSRLSDEGLAAALVEREGVAPGRATHLAFLSDGDYFKACNLSVNEANDDATLLLDWLRKCWRGNGVELISVAEQLAKLGRENQKQFLQYAVHFLRELLVLSVSGQSKLRLSAEETAAAANMSKVIDWPRIEAISNILSDNIYHIERNANPKILFLDTGIKLHNIMNQNQKT
jgi:DNA polymerase-3 subunit delta'